MWKSAVGMVEEAGNTGCEGQLQAALARYYREETKAVQLCQLKEGHR